MTAVARARQFSGAPRSLNEGGNDASLATAAMLEARSVALVGASARAGSFGRRMLDEVRKSTAGPAVYPVNPRYEEIDGARCYPTLDDLPERCDLVLLAVPDAALEQQLTLAAARGARAAVVFGNAHDPAPPAPALTPPGVRGSPPGLTLPGDGGSPPGLTLPGDGGSLPGLTLPGVGGPPPGVTLPGVRGSHPGVTPPGVGGPPPGVTLRDRLAAIARSHGMALCGAGCMGFVNASHGLRVIGYTEPDPVRPGPVALVTHSGSVFSALLRARRGFGFSLAVSSGQELVTAAPAYLDYALGLPETGVLALVLEAIRDGRALLDVLGRAAQRDIPVVLLTVGGSAAGRAMVAAHSGALAGSDGGWEALTRAYGVHRVGDLAELADTVELFAAGRRVRTGRTGARAGIATVHDSGLERAHVVDLADALGVPFGEIGPATAGHLGELLDPGLTPANPLDVWGTGADTRGLFAGCLSALAGDPAVSAVALAVDFVPELDGDESYPLAMLDVADLTSKPLAVLSNLPSAIDLGWATRLRAHGIPVLEGTRSGLLALRHLLAHADDPPRPDPIRIDPIRIDPVRRERGAGLFAAGELGGTALLDLLSGYGITVAASLPASDADAALAAAEQIGYPVVVKTGQPGIAHKSDVGGVLAGIRDADQLAVAYADLARRLGPDVLVCQQVAAGVELALGIVADPELGPLIVVGAGGVLVELLADRGVALPPVSAGQARGLLEGLRVSRLLAGVRGAPAADLDAVTRAITGLSDLAVELGDRIEALDINPLICGADGAIAVDALLVPRAPD
jgi:acetate---CoA ligase (ADP-forming)